MGQIYLHDNPLLKWPLEISDVEALAALFAADKHIIFGFHGYPWLIHRLTYRRTNRNLHVRGCNLASSPHWTWPPRRPPHDRPRLTAHSRGPGSHRRLPNHWGVLKSLGRATIACQSQGAVRRSSDLGASGPGSGTGRHRLSGGCQVAGHD